MGIESDQLVFDYLSRVGDVAHQRQLPSNDRMRLVTSLRNEIDSKRGGTGGDSPAAVKRILAQLGTPDAVVQAASGRGATPYDPPSGGLPLDAVRYGVQDGARPSGDPGSGTVPSVPRQPGPSGPGPSAPGAGGGTPGATTDWWRVDSGLQGAARHGTGERTDRISVGGFVGGLEIPDILRPPGAGPRGRPSPDGEGAEDGVGDTAEDDAVEAVAEAAAKRRWWRREAAVADGEAEAGTGFSLAWLFASPLVLLAAVLLVAGAVFGNIWMLLGGWALAYLSRTLTRNETKFAVFWLPGLAVAGGLVWLMGRDTGHWGQPIPHGGMGHAVADAWPVVVRVAAVSSALFLLWRSRRRA